jgi:hypothetical protein
MVQITKQGLPVPEHTDETMSAAWWNRLTLVERNHWMAQAGSTKASDAWAAFKEATRTQTVAVAGVPTETRVQGDAAC